MMRRFDALVLLMLLAMVGCWKVACATDYYVAQEDAQANDANPGTPERPFRTLGKACEVATAGDTVYVRKGMYREPLIPKHSGAKGKPIVFQAYANDVVMIKGSEALSALEREGPDLWVKRPWTRGNYWEDSMREISVAPYGSSARIDQVFVNEQPLQWVPARAELKPGFFYEISSEGMFRRNISFANYGRGGEFYGAGFVLSASGKTVVEDNVVIGGSGGISVGNADRDDVHPVVGNTIQRNLVVEPELAALCVESGKRDPTAPEANNRFLENTFLVRGADSRLAFGSRRFTSAGALDEAAAGAQGNRSPSDLTQLDTATAERLNDALKRVLNALRVADARLDVRAPGVRLEAIWRLRGPGKATGYWLRAQREHYLLLDVAVPGEIRLTGSGTPLLWDFPVLRAPVRAPLVRVGETFTAHVEGPCALVIGLGDDAHPSIASPGQTPVE